MPTLLRVSLDGRSESPPPEGDLSPRLVGKYAIYDRIGTGGMGAVHLGQCLGPHGFSRTVVLKTLHPELTAREESRHMLADEAKIASRIYHPHVVSTLDVVADRGQLFLVMEYIAGESLADVLHAAAKAGQRVPLPIAIGIMAGVLHGLHAAHEATDEAGIPLWVVHRDVSPSNILIGVDGLARITDFGVAKALKRAQKRTAPGEVKGKLFYMAPEQAVGGDVTPAADVYAAGLVLWQVVAGRHPFAGADRAEAHFRAISGVSEFPSRYARPSRGESLSDADEAHLRRLDGVVMRALERAPQRRYPTARDMALALEAIVTTTPLATSEWLTSLAGARLDDRARRVQAIEMATHSLATCAAPPPVRGAMVQTGAPVAGSRPPLVGKAKRLKPGDAAPEIDAICTNGARFVLSESQKRYGVLFFFPSAFGRICSREAAVFRDNYRELLLAGADVVGIGTDSASAQRAFGVAIRAPFRIIADEDASISRAYGVLWPVIAKACRVTYIVDRAMTVRFATRHELDGARHCHAAMLFLDRLMNTGKGRCNGSR